ncbi:MAG: TM0106 family RecB-like putative nuclease [Candidatus Yanofskybacteria bacterium]|nr:TM0106 family RecB-like putative nuclease [Candidatus Yanofskybacteria bacterium]
MPETQKLTSAHFYKFFQCPHWIWYDIYADSSKKREISPLLDIIYKGKAQDGAKQLGAHKKFEELKPEQYRDLEEAYMATLDLMRQGKNIYHGVLMTEDWVGMPDLLEARPGKSSLGNFHYVVYDVQRTLELRDEQKFPLVFYSLILEKIQGVRPKEAYIIDPNGNERSFLVDDFVDQFHMTRADIERILAGEKPAPFLKSSCKRTPWYSLCLEGAEGCNDVSLIYRLSQADQRRLYGLGIHTVSDLAAADSEELRANLEDWQYDKIVRFQNQAKVLLSGQPLILRKSAFPEVATEIFFDIESDPTRDVDYLLGMLVRSGSAGDATYEKVLAESPGDEQKIWHAFLDKLAGWEDFAIYHYAFYERMVFDRLALRYGAPSALSQKFHEHAIDLHQKTVDSVVLPLYFYTLKDVAKYIGYAWADPDAGGAESVSWYDQWLATGDRTHLERVVRYNEDDVRATMLLKDWLSQQKPTKSREVLEDER